MIVTCPNCNTKYNLPDGKIGPKGLPVRCARCKHVFHVDQHGQTSSPEASAPQEPSKPAASSTPKAPKKPAPPPPPPPVEDDEPEEDETDLFAGLDDEPEEESQAPSPEDNEADDLFGPSDDEEEEPQAPSFEDSETDDLFGPSDDEEDDVIDEDEKAAPAKGGFSLEDDDTGFDLDAKKKDKKESSGGGIKKLLLLGGILLLILALTAGALFYLGLIPGLVGEEMTQEESVMEEQAQTDVGSEAPAPKATAQASESLDVSKIVLQNVRQYYVKNEKIGQLFVIEGNAKNQFQASKELIELEANLFDGNGASVASKKVMGGNTVSLFQLQVMTKEELENALNSQVGVLTNNTDVKPEQEVPFMIVFFDIPENVQEYQVKVISAKNPAS
ncbi:DUF3426 domain-containing protein [Desulfovibrio inopinatus]|uniref:DUF3426 domain-containing protein n=1 Tax=Desulfovibrio inopinatus TaxID=102109 RepID=UPI00048778D9|nr:DUF3426 domain-containing protein [Desulfovibrio inopinatus]